MNLDKIIYTLNLTSSDTRDETIKCMIENVLFSNNQSIEEKKLLELIQSDFDIELFESDLSECVHKLKTDSIIDNSTDNKLALTPNRRQELLKVELEIKEDEQKRQQCLVLIIKNLSNNKVNEIETNHLIELFKDYLYECFLLYGRKAIALFAPLDSLLNTKSQIEILNSCLNKIQDSKLKDLFKLLVQEFPNMLDSNYLSYLEKLAKKTECFFSLGLSREQHEEIINLKIIDWVIFLDTNFLYSILNLHNHPETPACLELLKLSREHKLSIKYSYINDTKQELINKKKDFEGHILNTNYTTSQINAMIKSGNLDEFSKSYFQSKLTDPENTPHPTEIIDNHIAILKQKGVQIYQSKFNRLRKNDNLIQDQISKFRNYEKLRNDVRQEKGFALKNEKDLDLLEHDVFLREAIISLRNYRATSLNEIKYFGLSLDKTLINFDRNEVKRSKSELKAPVFFLPSILLSKITKFLPIITDDYKRAFITAISSIAFEESNKKTSLILQQSAKKFHNMGIEDEGVILECVSNKLFLEGFEKTKTSDEEKFIESEINKVVKKLEEENSKLQEKLIHAHEKYKTTKNIEAEKDILIIGLNSEIKEKQELLSIYKRESVKTKELLEQKSSDNSSQQEIPFEVSKKEEVIIKKDKKISLEINVTKMNELFSILFRVLSIIILLSNIIGFLLIVITGIIESSYDKSLPIASIGLTLLLYLFPDFKHKKLIFRSLSAICFIIFVIYMIYNWDQIISIKELFNIKKNVKVG